MERRPLGGSGLTVPVIDIVTCWLLVPLITGLPQCIWPGVWSPMLFPVVSNRLYCW